MENNSRLDKEYLGGLNKYYYTTIQNMFKSANTLISGLNSLKENEEKCNDYFVELLGQFIKN